MFGLLLFLAAAGALAYASVVKAASKGSPAAVGRFLPSTLSSNTEPANPLYRVSLRVPLSLVSQIRAAHGELGQKMLVENIRQRATRMGHSPILLVTQDPSNGALFTILARRSGPLTRDPLVEIVKVETVEEPPASLSPHAVQAPNALPRVGASGELPRAFDPGLTEDEARMICHALLFERNARHLGGIAETLEPWFPVSASVLRAKAMFIEARVPMTEERSKNLLREVTKNASVHEDTPSAKANLERHIAESGIPEAIARDEVKRAASLLIEDPNAKLDFLPTEVEEAARCLVREMPFTNAQSKAGPLQDGIWMVCPKTLRALLPPKDEDSFVSPSALQLALAVQKPEWSGVSGREKARSVYQDLSNKDKRATNLKEQRDLVRARNQMERAKRAIERRRWIEWYRRSLA